MSSPKRITERLKLSKEEAKELSAAMRRASGDTKEVDGLLEKVNKRLNGFGIEAIRGSGPGGYYMDIVLLYVNRGDTYDDTVLYDTTNERFIVGSWGDWVEAHGEKYHVE